MKTKDVFIITFLSLLIAIEQTAALFIGGKNNTELSSFLIITMFVFTAIFCWMVSYKQNDLILKQLEKINEVEDKAYKELLGQ